MANPFYLLFNAGTSEGVRKAWETRKQGSQIAWQKRGTATPMKSYSKLSPEDQLEYRIRLRKERFQASENHPDIKVLRRIQSMFKANDVAGVRKLLSKIDTAVMDDVPDKIVALLKYD